ncbi:uncharacterized protein MONOS_1882 [Monocercomonoides exilis]|uniref:uncharacterized protein n=1 Tax=Monocercomonoides exilis TaxID=2049356 RepID=UPI00355A4C6B|nr:hypothetical protein MONOS_1882 [Monocercomonoides exilis]|eukprot:MONOS_1882.1-p1 / transcript=MONOS_1882.1 / gene=MONOS_1882 / organism=Monocercomonoides_exilis_PA203 / gene_product=unspecified product / transcript_product=unspecified product / location=Mono_scaffold00036:19323-25397(-) / protein_length=2025 / sequence_SO=supercontig / SO=protein_coding / is_pseudo=false
MSGCSFSSVWDAYDGCIVPSLNSPSSSLAASNISFARCYRSQNVAVSGSEGNPSKPARQQIADNEANSFTWCEWSGSKATETSEDYSNQASNGGAIFVYGLTSGSLSICHCAFSECSSYWCGGGILCVSINSINIENSSFNACTAQNYEGGGMDAYDITSCVRISGCKFTTCNGNNNGGGLHLSTFQVSGQECIETENNKGDSVCVFECLFTSCFLSGSYGGGMRCFNVPVAFQMRSIQLISCNATARGGGLYFEPFQSPAPSNNIYCYFFFFHDCSCNASTPYGHDVMFYDFYNLFSLNNPFYESYTTNPNDTRVCYVDSSLVNQETQKMDWLKEGKLLFVGENGNDSNELCGTNETKPCQTIGHCVNKCNDIVSFGISVLNGKHVSEGTTINVGEKKISVVGRGKTVSVIGTSALSTSSSTLFSISSGQLEVGHVGIDHNATRSPSPSVFVVSLGSGTLSLEDVLISSSVSEEQIISTSVFEVALGQLKMIDVEIKNMKTLQPLFAESSSEGSSSGESVLANVTIRNVNRTTGGDGVVMAKNVKGGETFVVWNTTMEGCECANGNGGGIKVELASSTSKGRIGASTSLSKGTTKFNKTKCSGYGGGVMLHLLDTNAKFELSEILIFEDNNAAIGKNAFISASDLNKTVTNASFKFDYSSMKDDKTLFVGSDIFHSNKDLFMFLIPYSSMEIFISSEGFDVARCGSEKEPCQSMWKGMGNIKEGDETKAIQIEGSTIIQDTFNMSNYQIKKSIKMGEENTKAVLNFEKAAGSQLEHFMVNNDHLELSNIQFQLMSGFDNSAKTIISNKEGALVIIGCSFHSEAGMSNGFDCVFVDAIGGSVEVNDLSMKSCNVGNSIFAINNAGVSCQLKNVRVKLLNERGGCLLLIKGPESTTKINEGGEEMNLNIDNSSFSGVKRSDNGASILESKSEKKIELVVKKSNIAEDKAEDSEKGGAIFFTLGSSGSMNMIDSTISHCSCSNNNGRGGGIYLATKERGELNFSFVGMKFSDNGASVGKDVFIDCFNISSQINETQFQFDLREGHYSRINAIYGMDSCDYPSDTDLIEFVTIHQSDTIIVNSLNGSNEKQCGTNILPCYSINHGLMHLTSEYVSLLHIDTKSAIEEEINLKEMSLSSKSRDLCEVEVKSSIGKTRRELITTTGTVSLVRVNFVFDSNFISQHESLISPEGGILEVMNCSFTTKQLTEGVNEEFANIPYHIFNMAKGELQLDGCAISNLILHESALSLSSSQLPSVIDSLTISNSTIETFLIDINECGQLTIKDFNTENITVEGNGVSLISCLSMKKTMQLANCTIGGVSSKTKKGKLMKLENCLDVKMDSCIFDGSLKERNEQYLNEEEEMCRWEGSLVDIEKSSMVMKVSTITNSPEGGITMSGGNVIIEKGEFIDNNPTIEGYPLLRRNIVCSDSGTLNVMSLKGGDGWERNTSLWMLNEGCSFEGIVSERDSSFFIPVLESVEAKEITDRTKLIFKGLLLVPCNLTFSVVKRKGEEKEIEKDDFDSNGFLSETEVEGSVAKDLISSCGEEIEVTVYLMFGYVESPSSTQSFILKNASETKINGDEKFVEGRKERKSYWLLIVIVLVILLLIVLIVSIILAVRWRKQKRRTKELEIIVEDTVKKDPKAFEMVTMEMSPEEQWRRAEREAEKKNEERTKKRVYDSNMEHSESSEHLLSESGSTEYILGRDSDKIPQWMLEKVDEKEEEEETRKRSPSPSISSTSTTDSDSTFVRSESLCPTTSSMSNLVDAMACSSPHEKLIVDLRDSLFMLLHGRNKTKEMAIGTLREREQTAAQILFWVANLALHSFEECEVPLQSLSNLNPHIVLFSEHMIICIVMHSDFSSDDSDSSSISSSTVVTSASDNSDSLPSSTFEDEDDFKKECLRWKAPELLINKKMGATKESVVFSIGMMLRECLTLQIPFGEYEAEIAGQKIVNGERPDGAAIRESCFAEIWKQSVGMENTNRPSLVNLKREFFKHFPKEAVIVTVSDAIDYEDDDEEKSLEVITKASKDTC